SIRISFRHGSAQPRRGSSGGRCGRVCASSYLVAPLFLAQSAVSRDALRNRPRNSESRRPEMLAYTCLGTDTLQARFANRRVVVKNRVALIAAAALIIGGGAACSSPSAKRAPGTLTPGTAQLTIDGKELPPTRAVECAPAEEYLTTITTGSEASGVTVMVSNKGKLAAEFVRIRN